MPATAQAIGGFDLWRRYIVSILLNSGYPDRVLTAEQQARFQEDLLPKPYTLADLAERVRKLLDEPSPSMVITTFS